MELTCWNFWWPAFPPVRGRPEIGELHQCHSGRRLSVSPEESALISVIAHDNHDHFTLFFSFFLFLFLTNPSSNSHIRLFLSSYSSPTHKRTPNTIGFDGTICDTRHLLV